MILNEFSERAYQALVAAHHEATSTASSRIGTEHLLLGLLTVSEEVRDLLGPVEGLADEARKMAKINDSAAREPLVAPLQLSKIRDILTVSAREVIEITLAAAKRSSSQVEPVDLLRALAASGAGGANAILRQRGLRPRLLSTQDAPQLGVVVTSTAIPSDLTDYLRDMVTEARLGHLDPVLGRDNEVRMLTELLVARSRRSVTLAAEAGIGTEPIVNGLCQRIVQRLVPPRLEECRILRATESAVALFAASSNGDPEPLLTYLAGVDDVVVHVPDIAAMERDTDPLLALLSALRSRRVQTVLSVESDELRERLSEDLGLTRGFESVEIDELSQEAAVEYLKGIRDGLEAHHRVTINDEALVAAVQFAGRTSTTRFLPDSAVELLDSIAANLQTQMTAKPPVLVDIDRRIAEIRAVKEAAIDSRDFESAARHRDLEKHAMLERAETERTWRESSLEDRGSEIDEGNVLSYLRDRRLLPATVLELQTASTWTEHQRTPELKLRLLNDVPINPIGQDHLGSQKAGKALAELLAAVETPFVLSVDAGWGMGKSTLLRAIESALARHTNVVTVQYNAWTSDADDTLQDLIRSVLSRLDTKTLRKWRRKAHGRRPIRGVIRVASSLIGRIFGVSWLVDEVWSEIAGPGKSGNDLKDAVRGMLTDWVSGDSDRRLIVFVDDLDRCSNTVILRVCEAVKLYLDAPGLVFVLACDMQAIARGVQANNETDDLSGRLYLEKIIQVAHRVAPPNREQVKSLLTAYAATSGTSPLITTAIELVLIDRCGGNPRRVKRILNGFVVERQLNPSWIAPPMSDLHLMSAVILRDLYPSLFAWVSSSPLSNGTDRLSEFVDYTVVRNRAADPPPQADRWWLSTGAVFEGARLAKPKRSSTASEMLAHLGSLEQRLPEDFPALALDPLLLSLIDGLGSQSDRQRFCAQLIEQPLTEALGSDEQVDDRSGAADGV